MCRAEKGKNYNIISSLVFAVTGFFDWNECGNECGNMCAYWKGLILLLTSDERFNGLKALSLVFKNEI